MSKNHLDQISFYAKFQNINLNQENIKPNNILTFQDLVNSPKEKLDNQKSNLNSTNTTIRKFNLSNSSLKDTQNNFYSGAYTTKNKGSIKNFIIENSENANKESVENNSETNVNTISNFNTAHNVYI